MRLHLGSAGRGQAVATVQANQGNLGATDDVKCVTKNLTVRFLARAELDVALTQSSALPANKIATFV